MLNAVGVTGVAGQVYSTLIEADQATIEEIAVACGVSARRAAAELAALEELGLAYRLAGRPARYRANAPDVAIAELIAQREAELQTARATMHQLAEIFRETARSRHPDGQVEVVRGPDNIARAVARAAEATRHQLRGFDRPPYTETPGASYGLEERRMAAGVAYRVIYDAEALDIPGRMAGDILPSVAAGEQARARPALPIKLIISDDQLAVIPAAITSRTVDTTFIIHRSPILSALIALFEAEWERATPILGTGLGTGAIAGEGAGAGRAGDHPDAETAALLAMLAAGMTDASIARSLEWSMRTTQRRMAQLMSELGVTSRFQAGVAVRDRGWL
jgi:Sugar-specific transcriptional regulator TrmB/Bacterial regulatory proteins, luxR family